MISLADLVRRKIEELGDEGAAQFFDVCLAYVKQWKAGSRAIPAAAMEKAFADYYAKPAPAVYDPGWEGRRLSILLPWYKTTCPQTAFCLMGVFDRTKMRMNMVFGDAFIAHSRNTLSRMFLDSDSEWALMIDDDMVFPFGNADWFNQVTGFNFPPQFAGMHSIGRLLSHGKTLVGATYFGRSPTGKPMFSEGCNNPAEAAAARRGPRDLCRPTRWVATGLLLIHRKVFLDINAKFPDLGDNWFSPSEHDLTKASAEALKAIQAGDSHRAVALLDAGLTQAKTNSRLGMGEDVVFNIRAAAAGHVPHIDLGLVCGHVGHSIYGPFNTRESAT